MVHVWYKLIYFHWSYDGCSANALKRDFGAYLNCFPLDLICPPSVVPQACNNTFDINLLCIHQDLAYWSAMYYNIRDIFYNLNQGQTLPTFKASSAANSSIFSSIKLASLLSSFPRTGPGQRKPHVDLYA